MASKLFVTEIQRKIEDTIIKLLNNNQLMNYNTVNSPRAVGDIDHFKKIRDYWENQPD